MLIRTVCACILGVHSVRGGSHFHPLHPPHQPHPSGGPQVMGGPYNPHQSVSSSIGPMGALDSSSGMAAPHLMAGMGGPPTGGFVGESAGGAASIPHSFEGAATCFSSSDTSRSSSTHGELRQLSLFALQQRSLFSFLSYFVNFSFFFLLN